APLYESLADAVVLSDSPRGSGAALPAIAALAQLPAGTRLVWATSDTRGYPAYIGRGLLESGWWPLASRRFCVTDSAVGALYAERLPTPPLRARRVSAD